MNQGASIQGLGYFYGNTSGLIAVAFALPGRSTTVTTGDQNTTVICIGGGDFNVFLGDGGNDGNGRNTVFSGGGNDLILGGAGYDTIHAGAGNDIVWGASGYNFLDGGFGNDTIYVGSGDAAYGGPGSDNFTIVPKENHSIAEYTYLGDLSFLEGDKLDISTFFPEVTPNAMRIDGDNLLCDTNYGTMTLMGVGEQITLVGGVNAAIAAGYISTSWFYG